MGNSVKSTIGVQRALIRQPHDCGSCGEEHKPADNIAILQVVRVHRVQDTLNGGWAAQFESIVEADGDFSYPPYFFHLSCWDETQDELAEIMQGYAEPPRKSHTAVCTCTFCREPIEDGDNVGIVSNGNFILSEQQPDGEDALGLRLDDDPQYLCVECLNELNVNIIEGLYDEDTFVPGDDEDTALNWGSVTTS